MKDKTITIIPKGISQKQWSSFLLELNLMKKAWKPFGVNVEIKASGLRNVLKWGTTVHDDKKMELDIIVLKDELYHLVRYAKNVTECFDICDVIRENITTYIDSINRHIIKEGVWAGGQFFGCICR